MKWRFKAKQQKDAPFLSPLSQQANYPISFSERMPSAVAPIAFTVVGGLALVVVIASLLGTAEVEAPAPMSQDLTQSAPETAAVQAVPVALPVEAPQVPVTEVTAESLAAAEVQSEPDPALTGSILSAIPTGNALLPSVEIAETEDEIAALESAQRQQVDEPGDVPAEQATVSIAEDDNLRDATTTGHVNMRSGPSDEAEILTVVPARTRIQAEADCNWCAAVYEGRSGYVYRTFLSYE